MIAIKKYERGGDTVKNMDIFFEQPGYKREYAFSTKYNAEVYELCKSSVRVNQVSGKRSRSKAVMRFINYLNLMLPYLVKELNLPVVA